MKRVWLVTVSFLLLLFAFSLSSAQLINYGRRSKFLGEKESAPDSKLPSWVKELPEPQNEDEKRYDTNRDGKLQSAEVKVYLRDIIERVESQSYISVTTDLLREYDKNKDGVINKNELELMKEHVR